MTRIFRYILTHDTGMAPCPSDGLTTATFKPVVRRVTRPGDWVFGLRSGSLERGLMLWAGRVANTPSHGSYAANPGVVDLETGLPSAGRAPRMDLAVVQRQPDGAAALALWEAKCSDNAELRATRPAVYREDDNGDQTGGIPVIGRLRKYQRWMTDERRDEVRAAFAQTARILLALADHFARPGDEARAEWHRLLATPRPEIILPPAL